MVEDELPDELAVMVDWGKSLKEMRVGDASSVEEESLPPVLQFMRDGKPVAICFCTQVDRDAGLQAAKIGVPGYSADELFFMVDAWGADQKFYEEFGRDPDPGEFQRLYEEREILKHSIEMESTLELSDTKGNQIVAPGGDLTSLDVLGELLQLRLKEERGASHQADERQVDRNRAQRRRDEAAARKKARS